MLIIKKKNIYKFSKNWSEKSAQKIVQKIPILLKKKKRINFFLTGGKTAARFYPSLKKNLLPYKKYLKFYLTDERFVKKNSTLLNSNLINTKFVKDYFDKKNFYFNLFKESNGISIQNKIKKYNQKFKSIDIVLLSLGYDGHIASIFENYYSRDDRKKFFFFKKKDENFYRISLTLNSILKAKYLFILVKGKKRVKLLNNMKNKKTNFYPAKIVYKKAVWLIKK
jgi:6-phosphogluconolactonase